ncbi:recombinase family protein [Clostridium sp.]|uniref:recombinase family protein n=1 Tax=Clostridium sp. TaxID=1506 RepID=UPI0029042CC1|nr:recombinase family protein [Clostridium sp.]MDU2680146.1 recombinase family protein [Clostridium sp.]
MRVAIYSRKSKLTDKGESIENQIKIIKSYFHNNKDVEFEVFEEEGFSGKNTKRPAFTRMMKKVDLNYFDIVAVYRLDRIARNVIDFAKIYEKFESKDVKFLSVTEQFDTSTPMGRMMMYIIATFAEIERDNLISRVIDNKKELAKLGQWSGGTPPVGYKAIKEICNGKKVPYLELDKDMMHIPKLAFKWCLEGYSLEGISKKFLIDLNYKLARQNISRLLSNPVYVCNDEIIRDYYKSMNIHVYNEVDGKSLIRNIFQDETIIASSKHEPIISSENFIKVQILLKDKAIDPKPRISSKTFLAQRVKCGYCNTSYRIDVAHSKDIVRKQCKCGRNIEVKNMEQLVLGYLQSVVDGDIKIKEYDNTDLITSKKTLEKNIEKNKAILNGLLEKVALAETSIAEIMLKKASSIQSEIRELEIFIKDIEFKIEESYKNNNIKTVRNLWINFNNCTSIAEKQRIFKMMVDSILWYPEPGSRKNGVIKIKF